MVLCVLRPIVLIVRSRLSVEPVNVKSIYSPWSDADPIFLRFAFFRLLRPPKPSPPQRKNQKARRMSTLVDHRAQPPPKLRLGCRWSGRGGYYCSSWNPFPSKPWPCSPTAFLWEPLACSLGVLPSHHDSASCRNKRILDSLRVKPKHDVSNRNILDL